MGLYNSVQHLLGKRTGRLEMSSSLDIKTDITTRPIIADLDKMRQHVAVFGTKDGRLFAVKEDKIEWVFSPAKAAKTDMQQLFQPTEFSESIQSEPRIMDINYDGNMEIVFGRDDGSVYALDSNGNYMWEFQAKGPVKTTPLISIDGHERIEDILFGSSDSNLYCLDSLGGLKWISKAASGIESSPAFLMVGGKRRLVFGSNDGTLYCISIEGKLVWKHKCQGKITASPAVGDVFGDGEDHIVVGTNDGFLYLFDHNGEVLWTYKAGASIPSSATLADINGDKKMEVLFGCCDDQVYALASDGNKLWSYETSFWVVAPPIAADVDGDGRLEIVACSYDHSVYVLDAEGQFLLNYVPGVAGITQQSGSYSDIMTIPPGRYIGKKIWEYKTDGMIVGSSLDAAKVSIVVTTGKGKMTVLKHKT